MSVNKSTIFKVIIGFQNIDRVSERYYPITKSLWTHKKRTCLTFLYQNIIHSIKWINLIWKRRRRKKFEVLCTKALLRKTFFFFKEKKNKILSTHYKTYYSNLFDLSLELVSKGIYNIYDHLQFFFFIQSIGISILNVSSFHKIYLLLNS